MHELEMSQVKKLSPLKTYFTLLKGFIATGVLYMPKNFKNAGWAWGAAAMFISYIFTHICIILLLKTRAMKPGASFTELGFFSGGRFA